MPRGFPPQLPVHVCAPRPWQESYHIRLLFASKDATDISTGSARALTYASSLAEEDRAELILLHVIESEAVSEPELLKWKQQDREKLSAMVPPDVDLAYDPEIEVETGIPEVEIVRLADSRKSELIVMGSHPGGGVSTHVPWTTVHHILQQAPCPVLTVRGEMDPQRGAPTHGRTGQWNVVR